MKNKKCNGLRRNLFIWVVACELITSNHEREREKEIESEGKRVSKTQGKCLLVQAQGRTPLALVSPLWVVSYFAYLLALGGFRINATHSLQLIMRDSFQDMEDSEPKALKFIQ